MAEAEANQIEARTLEMRADDNVRLALMGGANVNRLLDQMLVHGRERFLLIKKKFNINVNVIVHCTFSEKMPRERGQSVKLGCKAR